MNQIPVVQNNPRRVDMPLKSINQSTNFLNVTYLFKYYVTARSQLTSHHMIFNFLTWLLQWCFDP